jgi:methyl-accepting chemotaxis protein
MNAAIEAAHAGEAGKGFAVVADEIRKLAENSGEQSKTISTVLKKIHEAIEKITKATENVLTKFEAITESVKIVTEQEDQIRTAMEEQNAGSKQVLDAISSLNQLTQSVKAGSAEMLEGSQQVIVESKNLESVTAEISNGMNEMAAGAGEINSAVQQVNELSDQNQNSIEALNEAVAKFKVDSYAFDYDLIVAKHRAWISNLREYIDNKNNALKANPDDYKNCALGKWIYGEGSKYSSSGSYKTLEDIHHNFHELAGTIIKLKDANKTGEAEAAFKKLMDYYHQIIDLLNKLRDVK